MATEDLSTIPSEIPDVDPEVFKKALARTVDIAQNALQNVQSKFQERQFYWNMYHSYDAILKEKQWWQTKFAHPFPFFTIEMKTSFCEEGIFGTSGNGLFQVHPHNDISSASATKQTKLLKYQEDQSDLHKEFYLGAKSLFVTGDWFIETYWDEDTLVYQERDRYLIEPDGITQEAVFNRQPGGQKRVLIKSQPNIRTIAPNSIWPDPKATSFETCRFYCLHRYYTFSQLKEMEELGHFINVDELKDTKAPTMPSNYYDTEPYSPYVKSGNPQKFTRNSPIDSEDPMIEVIHIIYPATGEWESIGNRRVYLGRIRKYKNINNPIIHIKNFEELNKMYGASDFLAIANHWRLINQYQCLEADNILMHHRGYTKIQRDAGPNVEEQMSNLRPGATIVTNNLGAISHERPDLFSPLVLQSKQDLINQAQQPMGLNEILQGATPSSNVRSSEQFSQLANFGAKLLSQSIRNIAAGLKQVGNKWLALNYEFLDADFRIPVIDRSGEVLEDLTIGQEDLVPWAPISVKLSSDLESQKNLKVQQMMQAVNMVQNVPGAAVPTMIKDLLRFQGTFPEVDKYFLLPDEQVAAMIMQQFQPQIPQNQVSAGQTRPATPTQVAQGNANAGAATIPEL